MTPILKTRPWLWSAAPLLPLLVWWLGWYPGFASSDTVDQLGQAQRGSYSNFHPAIHSMYLGVLSLGTRYPGLVSLFQVLVFVGLLVYAAKRLIESGAPAWMAVGAAWILGVSPAIGPMTISLWKDAAFGLLVLWAWIELLSIANKPDRSHKWPTLLRLGAALGGVWLFRGNGPITVLLLLAVIAVVWRRQPKSLLAVGATTGATVLLVVGVLYNVANVRTDAIEPSQVFLPDVAASFNTSPDSFNSDEVALLTALAPTRVWNSRYDCFDSTPLLFDPEFDHSAIRSDPSPYRRLQLRVLARDPGAVASHRSCAANFVYQPAQPADAYFHRPPYEIPSNDIGLTREPLSDLAFRASFKIFHWAGMEHRLWYTWRPAIVILPALAAILAFGIFKPGRRFLIPSALFLAHLANVVVTSPAQEFRYAYPLYITGTLTVVLLYPTLRGRTQREGT